MVDNPSNDSSMIKNKCAACFRQFNRKDHLVEHMKISFHSTHEPICGVCSKHCRSFESLREHLIGPLPKLECSRVFSLRGCNLCMTIFDSPHILRAHRANCQFSKVTSRIQGSLGKTRGPKAMALGCKMVGGGTDGSVDLCASVCLVDEDENTIFHTYVKPEIPVKNYRYEITGIKPEFLKDAMPLKQVQRKIQDILCNGEPIWKIRSMSGKARVLVGHDLTHDLDCLGMEYPALMTRDTATYPPLMKTSKLSNSLKYLTQTYLGYIIQIGIQDPYDDCVAAMRLYMRMKSQSHRLDEYQSNRNFVALRQNELERMNPGQLLDISRSDYYCWCLDAK
ncbi:hypothetical protein ACHQM5_017780 [Ranunculus cassubicifolius]